MTLEELEEIKRKLPCEYLRYYGKPRELLTATEMEKTWERKYQEQKYEDKIIKKKLAEYEYPKLNEKEMYDFLYLRACVWLNKKPMGDFEGDAKICADTLQLGGDIVDMYKAGADKVYAACLSHYSLDNDIQREIIDAHIPF